MSELAEELAPLVRERDYTLTYQDLTPELLDTWTRLVDVKPEPLLDSDSPASESASASLGSPPTTPMAGAAAPTSAAAATVSSRHTQARSTATSGGDRTNCACVRCKQFKMASGNERPCKRCVRAGLGDECVDCVQKRPGRKPRQDRLSKELAVISFPKCFVFDGDVLVAMHVDPFANAALSILKNLETGFVNMLMAETAVPAPPSTFSEWLSTVEGVPSAPSLLRTAFSFVITWLTNLRQYCAEHNVSMREPFYRFLCRDFMFRARLYCVDDSAIQNAYQQLAVEGLLPSYAEIDASCQWLEHVSSLLMHAPMGVMGLRYKNGGTIQSVFVNERMTEIFSYTREEFIHHMLSSTEDIMMRLWHISEWGPMFAHWLATVLGLKGNFSRRGVFVRADGTKFEAVWSSQFTYTADGLPESILMYITPVSQ